jgi:Tfp pilus assembly protein PilO
MKNLLSAKGGWVAIVPCTVGLAAYLFLVFLPGMREIHELRADMVVKERYLSESATRAAREKSVEAEEAETREYLTARHGGSKAAKDGAALFGELSERFKAVGVTMTMFRPEAKTSFAAVDRLPVTVQCKGTYGQMQALLASMEQVKQRVWVDDLVLERGTNAGEDMRCELRLAIFVDNFEISD